jgi:hypothetical protein
MTLNLEREAQRKGHRPCSYAKYFANMSALCEFYFAACIFAEVGSLPTSNILHHDAVWQKKTGSQATRPYPIHPEATCTYEIYIVHVHMSVLDDCYSTLLENRIQPEKLIFSPD